MWEGKIYDISSAMGILTEQQANFSVDYTIGYCRLVVIYWLLMHKIWVKNQESPSKLGRVDKYTGLGCSSYYSILSRLPPN